MGWSRMEEDRAGWDGAGMEQDGAGLNRTGQEWSWIEQDEMEQDGAGGLWALCFCFAS